MQKRDFHEGIVYTEMGLPDSSIIINSGWKPGHPLKGNRQYVRAGLKGLLS
jgi:hypothetical protein